MGKKKSNAPKAEEMAPETLEQPVGEAKTDKAADTDAMALEEAVRKLVEAEDKLKSAEEKLQKADENAAQEKDKYLRLYAEYDNFRKRSQKEREALYNDVRAETVAKFLPVYDNLSRALNQGSEDKAFLKGVEMTMTQLEKVLEALGVTPIEAVGQPFDAALHEAVMHKEDDSLGENVVVTEFEKGFKLGDKVIRYSKVVVAN